MMWAKRVLVGSGVAAASLLMVSSAAGAATSNCVVTQTFNEPTCVVIPASPGTTGAVTTATTSDGPAPAATTVSASSTSLPFTGADVEELAVLGVGAIVAGGVLMRRRRRMSA
jgi:LPXTG-motif cell wall-anchored protein